jgi:hypothetical protein
MTFEFQPLSFALGPLVHFILQGLVFLWAPNYLTRLVGEKPQAVAEHRGSTPNVGRI